MVNASLPLVQRLALTADLAVAATHASASPSIPLLGATTYPEGVALDHRSGILYVGSDDDGSLQAIEHGVARVFQPAGTDGRTETLGLKVDEARDRLWVVTPAAVYVYQLADGLLLKRADLASVATVATPGLNDLALAADGTAYVTDSFNPLLLKIDGATLTLSVFRDLAGRIPYGQQNDFRYNLNGIVVAPDGRALLAVKTNEGTLWRISLETDDIAPVALTEPVTKGDGLVWGEGDALYVLRNFESKISKIDFAGDASGPRTVTTLTTEGLDVPTTAVFVATPEPHLVVVNSQFGKDPPSLPFHLVEVPLLGAMASSSATSPGEVTERRRNDTP